MGMTFNKGSFYPSDAKKKKKKKPKISDKEYGKIINPVLTKEGDKGEIAYDQLDSALSSENIGDGKKITKKGLKKIVAAAADDNQLATTKRSLMRHKYKGGGSAIRGLGRAFMKGGKV